MKEKELPEHKPLDVAPRACTGPFLCVCHVHVCVRVWMRLHVPVLAHFGVYACLVWIMTQVGGPGTSPERSGNLCDRWEEVCPLSLWAASVKS